MRQAFQRGLIDNKPARLPFRVHAAAAAWTTDQVKLDAVAVKLWNEAKRERKPKARQR
jgi:hypothetical protein